MRKIQGLFFLGLMVFLFSCKGGPDQAEADNVVVEDTLAKANEEMEELLGELNQRIADDPNNPNLYHERAFIYYRAGDFSKALKDVDRCLIIDSTEATFHFTKGEIFFVQLKMEEAKASYENTLRYKPDHWEAEMKIGRIYMYLKDFNTAMKRINVSLKINPNNAETYFYKGEIYEELEDSAKAASSFQTAVEQDPEYYDAYIRLGILYGAARSPLALEYYNTAIQLRPNSTEALYGKAIFCQENNLEREALDAYDKILDLEPGFFMAWYNKGYVFLEKLEDNDNAILMFNKAIAINPKYVEAYHNRGVAYERSGLYQQARENYKKALEYNPQYDLSALALENLDRQGR